MRFRKPLFATLILSSALFGAALAPASAANEINSVPGLTTAGAPLALHGFDPVAYFTVGKPVQGDAKYAASHNGAAYYFSSKANLEAFQANPAKYEPRYGGFCAYGVSVGKKFDGNPNHWKIIDGKLYLNLNAEIAEKFNADTAGAIKNAESNWPKIVNKAPSEL